MDGDGDGDGDGGDGDGGDEEGSGGEGRGLVGEKKRVGNCGEGIIFASMLFNSHTHND